MRNPFLIGCLLALASCSSMYISGNALVVSEETTEAVDLTLTVTSGVASSISGMQVDTVGDDTIVTSIDNDRARRFILSGLTGYRGRLRLGSVDLIVGGTSVWIDDENFKAHGPDGSIDVRLRAPDGQDLFDGRDLVLEGNVLRPVGDQQQ